MVNLLYRRQSVKRYSEDRKVYKERNRIESVFGNVKRRGRDYFNIRILLIWLFKTSFLKIFSFPIREFLEHSRFYIKRSFVI